MKFDVGAYEIETIAWLRSMRRDDVGGARSSPPTTCDAIVRLYERRWIFSLTALSARPRRRRARLRRRTGGRLRKLGRDARAGHPVRRPARRVRVRAGAEAVRRSMRAMLELVDN